METEKLYYNDAAAAFTPRCRTAAGVGGMGDRAGSHGFLPRGRRSACDRGTLERWDVLDVREEDGVIFHRLESPLLPGETVRGRVDLARRLDFTQQHQRGSYPHRRDPPALRL